MDHMLALVAGAPVGDVRGCGCDPGADPRRGPAMAG
jgi:hypothetical protein